MVYTSGIPSFVTQNYALTFAEDCKISKSPPLNFARIYGKDPDNRQFFRASLFTGPGADAPIADGNAVVFSGNFSNKVDRNDAIKLPNAGENFGVELNDTLLAVEARAPLSPPDSICYYLNHLRRGTYQLRFFPKHMQPKQVQAFLWDNYLKKNTPVSLTLTVVLLTLPLHDAASAAARRFKIIFRKLAALPVTFVSLNAKQKDANIVVEWKVENENNMLGYEVQTSLDGQDLPGARRSLRKTAGREFITGLTKRYARISLLPY